MGSDTFRQETGGSETMQPGVLGFVHYIHPAAQLLKDVVVREWSGRSLD